jgi:hypothetical protein
MGKFKQGQPRPSASGRKKGTPNNRTKLLKSITEDLGIDVPRRLGELLPLLEPSKQADVLLDLMSYIYPKRKAVEYSGPEGQPIQIVATRTDIKKILNDPSALAAMELLERTLDGSDSDRPN